MAFVKWISTKNFLSQIYISKKRFCVCLVKCSKNLLFWSAEIWICCECRPTIWTIGSSKSIFNWKLFSEMIKQDGSTQNKPCQKLINWGGRYILTHQTYMTLHYRITIYSKGYKVSMWQKIWHFEWYLKYHL